MKKENWKVTKGYVPQFIVISLVVMIYACGGSKKGDMQVESSPPVDIDKLLGIENTTQPTEVDTVVASEDFASKSGGEDEVLKLLGISPDKDESSPPPVVDNEPDEPQASGGLETLQSEIEKKEKLINDLRSKLAEKNRKIAEFQATSLAARQPAVRARQAVPHVGLSVQARYDRALARYREHNFKDAIQGFSNLLLENIPSDLADNCQYWIGESYYGVKNYEQAIAEFEKVFRYAETNKADAALLKLGLAYMMLSRRAEAKSQFELLIVNHPRSQYVERARRYLKKL